MRFGFSGGGAPADMIKLGLERRGVWAKLREARAARRGWAGRTRLHFACLTGVEDVQQVCEMVELGWPGSVDARDEGGCTPLVNVTSLTSIVRLLIALGADVNAASSSGGTALILACFFGRIDAVRVLIAAGANLNARDNAGDTPLRCSRETCNPAIEALLLAAGATAV